MASEHAEGGHRPDVLAQLELMLYLEEYLQQSGNSLASLRNLPEAQAKRLMADASVYASTRLSEVETRSRFVQDVHGVGHHA